MSTMTPGWGAPDRPVEFRDYWRVLRQRWYWPMIGAVVGTALGVAAGVLAPDAYTASTSVLLQPLSADPLSNLDGRNAIDMSTERQIATSRQVAVRTVEQLGDEALTPEGLAENLRVVIAEDTRVLRFEYEANDPGTAAARANEVVDTYLSLRQERGDQIVSRAQASAQNRVEQIGASLLDAQGELEQRRDEAEDLEEVPEDLQVSIRDLEVRLGTLTAQQALAQADLFNLPSSSIDVGSVITGAVPPAEPSGLGLRTLAILGLLVGLLAGVVAAFLLQAVDPRARRADDVEEALGVAALGLVRDPSPRRRRTIDARALERPMRRITSAVEGLLGEGRPWIVVLLDTGGGVANAVGAVLADDLAERRQTVLVEGEGGDGPMAENAPATSEPTTPDDLPSWVFTSPIGGSDIADIGHPSAPASAAEVVAELLPTFDAIVVPAPPLDDSTTALRLAGLHRCYVIPVVRLGSARLDDLRLLRRDLGAAGAAILGSVVIGPRNSWGQSDVLAPRAQSSHQPVFTP